jgi:hypothetical protein
MVARIKVGDVFPWPPSHPKKVQVIQILEGWVLCRLTYGEDLTPWWMETKEFLETAELTST